MEKVERTCPYCGKPMREGRMHSDNRLCWRPSNGFGTLLRGSMPEDGVPLPGAFGYVRGQDAPAFYCQGCGKILLDVRN